MRNIDNGYYIIDSRDIIKRLNELREMKSDYEQALEDHTEDPENNAEPEPLDEDDMEELRILEELESNASGSADWEYGEALIRDSYFAEYAEQLAGDIGAIDPKANWPLNHIDWDAAAEELKIDYMSVDYDGEEYWIRA